MFVDFISAFIHSKLTTKPENVGITPPFASGYCNGLYNKQTSACQVKATLNPPPPSTLLYHRDAYSIQSSTPSCTHNCKSVHGSNSILNIPDNILVTGLNRDNNETPTGRSYCKVRSSLWTSVVSTETRMTPSTSTRLQLQREAHLRGPVSDH